jgi:hypothetical protein
VNHLEGEVI